MQTLKNTLLIILLGFGQWATAQSDRSFETIAEEVDDAHGWFSSIHPRGDEYLALADFELSDEELKEIKETYNYDGELSENGDSIDRYSLQSFYLDKTIELINELLYHPDFLAHDVSALLDGIYVVKSDDDKLFNISFEENTGGSYQSRVSITHFFDDNVESLLVPDEAYGLTDQGAEGFFDRDGYHAIHTLDTKEGTKYILEGSVRGCNYCFGTWVVMASYQNGEWVEEFKTRIESRFWEGGVEYDSSSQRVLVNYVTDDLSPNCFCADENQKEDMEESEDETEEMIQYNCSCVYKFNGISFELESAEQKVYEEEED